MSETNTKTESLKLSVELVSAYVSHNTVPAEQLIPMLQQVYSSMISLSDGNHFSLRTTNLKPAVPIDQSVHEEYIVCLEDGKKLQMLKRHLKTVYNMTIEQYRERWNLVPEYPVVSPSYAKRRSAIAKSSGLGQTGRKRRLAVVA